MSDIKNINVEEPCFKAFMSLSEVLTGFSTIELYATGMSEIYFKKFSSIYNSCGDYQFNSSECSEEDINELNKLLVINKNSLSTQEIASLESEIRTRIKKINDASKVEDLKLSIKKHYNLSIDKDVEELINSTISIWYNGQWIDGGYSDLKSYSEGLIWKTFHSHAPGHKQPGFGSWSIKPLTAK